MIQVCSWDLMFVLFRVSVGLNVAHVPSNPAPNKGNNLQKTIYLNFWREKNELILAILS